MIDNTENIIIGKQMHAHEFMRLKNVMIIRHVHRWGGQIADRKFWEGSINGEVEDWNFPSELIKDAKASNIPFLVLRYHKNGKVSCVKKG